MSSFEQRMGHAGDVKFRAGDAPYNGYFDHSVAIGNDTIVVGAPATTTPPFGLDLRLRRATSSGGATYDQVAKLTASDAAYMDLFGESVAIDGTTVVVGAGENNQRAHLSSTPRTTALRTTSGQANCCRRCCGRQGARWQSMASFRGDRRYGNSAGSGSGYVCDLSHERGDATYGQVAKLTAAGPPQAATLLRGDRR